MSALPPKADIVERIGRGVRSICKLNRPRRLPQKIGPRLTYSQNTGRREARVGALNAICSAVHVRSYPKIRHRRGDSLLLLASTSDPLGQSFPVGVVLRGKLPAAGVEGVAARLGGEWL